MGGIEEKGQSGERGREEGRKEGREGRTRGAIKR